MDCSFLILVSGDQLKGADIPTQMHRFYRVALKRESPHGDSPNMTSLISPPRIAVVVAVRSPLGLLVTLPCFATLFLVPTAVAVVIVIGISVVRISDDAPEDAITGIAVTVTTITSTIVVIIPPAPITPATISVTAIAPVRVASVAIPSSRVILGTRRYDKSNAYETKKESDKT